MSNKVKVVTCLSTALRPRSRIRSPSSISTVPKWNNHNQANLTIYDPNLPGCSKWFSSINPSSTISQRSFFTPNTQSQNRLHTVTNQSSYDDGHNIEEENSSRKHHVKTPHLPLPPSLPYSPNSYPFKRHLEILSLSLYSTPDESWSVYTALHSSLGQYIPDETFKSLISHQADHAEQRRAWHRVKALLRLAKKCRMSLGEIDSETLIKVLRLGFRRYRALPEDGGKKEEDYRLIRILWSTLEEKLGVAQIPHEVKRGWLGLQHVRLQIFKKTNNMNQMIGIEETALDMVRKGAASELGFYMGQILISSSGSTKEGLEQSLRNLIWCIAQGVDIKQVHLLKTIRKLGNIWSDQGEDGLEKLNEKIPLMMNSLNVEAVSNTSRILYQALGTATRRARSRVQKALLLVEENKITIGEMISRGISISISAQTDTIVKLKAAIRLLELAIQNKDNSCEALISAITIALYNAKKTATTASEIDKLIIQYARLIHESQITVQLPSQSIMSLLRLILSSLPSPEAYILSRKIYQYARSASPPFIWSRKNSALWQKLFRYSLSTSDPQLHFASRLYTDLMADGIPIRRTDALMLIRAIGSKSSPSRAILLERHIKDYLWSSYGSKSPLILALTQGLSKGGIKDTDLALNLAARISEGKPLQSSVIELVIGQLSKSTRKGDRLKIFHLLRNQLTDDKHTAIKNYNTVLSYLINSSKRNSISDDVEESQSQHQGQLSHSEGLAYAIYLYREMIDKGIKPNGRTISTMIRSLIDSGYLDSALSVFKACTKQSHLHPDNSFLIKSNSVGRLMVNLAMNNRFKQAYEVESDWRKVSTTRNQRSWDKGVIGARLLVDIKSGKQVDVQEVMLKAGWEGKKGFLNFLETLKPPSPPPQTIEEKIEDIVNQPTTEDKHFSRSERVQTSFWDSETKAIQERKAIEGRKEGIDSCMSSNLGLL
ncbi:uncharacterized protein L201_003535 [Kwoniella dendrophila CBS 6074]|uniref:Uncharacterized protein n=1 Tax=Kwoniella dendrophila CBS 6074 TaxID=1295534 RepID=A0AAX4JTC4_9TREE